MTGDQRVRLLAVGDVIVNRSNPGSAFDLSRDLLSRADMVFGNCESVYASSGSRNPGARTEIRGTPESVDAIAAAGFNVMSFANNHHMDSGLDAFAATIDRLKGRGIGVCGAGSDLESSRRPAILTAKNIRVAFLGYSSILLSGYAATTNRPGCAPLRIHTYYEMSEPEQPGCPAKTFTTPNQDDLKALVADVRAAKQEADFVVVTPHWGIHFLPAVLADYQSVVAKAAIDAGADLVLGHHQHILKGIEVYRGKVIFHGLGNFVADFAIDSYVKQIAGGDTLQVLKDIHGEYAFGPREGYPTLPFHPEARMTLIAQCEITSHGIEEVSFVPCLINPDGQPEPLRSSDARFFEIAEYVRNIGLRAGLSTALVDAEDRVRVALSS